MYIIDDHVEGLTIRSPYNIDDKLGFLAYDGQGSRFALDDSELDFLGICLGSKKCKEKRAARQDQRQIRREAKTTRVVGRTGNVLDGGSANPGVAAGIQGIASSLGQALGGFMQGQQANQMPMDQAGMQPMQAGIGGGNNKIALVIGIGLVLGLAYMMFKKDKETKKG